MGDGTENLNQFPCCNCLSTLEFCLSCLLISSFSGVPSTSIRQARLVFIRLRRLELVTIYVIEASVPTIILFCVIRDVDDLYKWQTFRPSISFIRARFRMSHVRLSCLKLSMFCARFHIKNLSSLLLYKLFHFY